MKLENEVIFKRVRYRYIYRRLLESGTFNGYKQTPEQSVRAIGFERALSELSLENAMT